MIGLHIQGRYQIERELGRGGMGIVYQARDKLLERPVAIKVVSAAAISTEGRSRLLLEAQAAAQISHPNVVTIFDVGETMLDHEKRPSSYIVMELIQGKMLGDAPPEDVAATAGIARQICAALAAAHEQGIIHRDLKPENILITVNGLVKLTDFGLAQIQGRARVTQEGAVIGTLAYMAPEIILGREAGPHSDLYSFGILLYELLAGRSPFAGDSPTSVLSQHLYAPVVPPSTHNGRVPPAADDLVLQLLRKEPGDRPVSAGAVGQRLDLWLEPEPLALEAGLTSQLDRLTRGRLIGRGQEFDQAIEHWLEAKAGHNQLLLISGEPGIGKSRFARELVTYAEFSGGLVLSGRCYQHGSMPYGPLKEIIGSALALYPDLDLPPRIMSDLHSLAPGFGGPHQDLMENAALDLEASQERLFDSLATLCQILTQFRPLLLFIDDIHWADSASMGFLRHLARRSTGWPLLILATYRDVELTAKRPAQGTLRDLGLEGLTRRIKLQRLDSDQTTALLATLFAEEISAELAQIIYLETEGNPFFVEEVSRSLVESGELFFDSGRWHRSNVTSLLIPENIHLAIESRLENVPNQEIALLQTAALLGRHFDFNMLVAVSDLPEETIIETLERAVSLQLIGEDAVMSDPYHGLHFSFTHALIQSVLLSLLSNLRRQRMQLKIAEKLEQSYPDRLEELSTLLGVYYSQAGLVDKAIQYYLMAGDVARKLFAHDEAIEAYEQALILLREGQNAGLTARTLMKLGLMRQNNHDFELARQAYDEAFDLQRRGAELLPPSFEHIPAAPHAYRDHKFEPSSLDPVFAASSEVVKFVQLLFSGLVYLHPSGEIMPDVAWRWDIAEGGAGYIFHLREDVFWSDGQPVTASDFEFAWKRQLKPEYGQNPALLFYDIVGAKALNLGESSDPATIGVQAEDAHTLRVNLIGPVSHFLQIVSQAMAVPVPSHIVDGDPTWAEPGKIITNGPFRVKNWLRGQGAVLRRYAHYHGHFQGNVEEISSSFLDPALIPARYAAGDLDVLDINQIREEDQLKVIRRFPEEYNSIPLSYVQLYWVDVNRAPMDNRYLRQALAWAIDRHWLVDNLWGGLYYPATGGIVPPGIPGHVPGIATPSDPDTARRLLGQAGFPGGEGMLPIEIVTGEFPTFRSITREIARQWREILHIPVDEITIPAGEFRERWLSNPPHVWMLGWTADYPDPYNFLFDASWRPIGGWQHDTYDKLIREAWRCSNREERLALYAQVEQIIVEEAPVVPLAYIRQHRLIKPWIKNWQLYNSTNDPFFPKLVIEPH
jgi:ABC-type oligopeptide transport system substrate-binding subunit